MNDPFDNKVAIIDHFIMAHAIQILVQVMTFGLL